MSVRTTGVFFGIMIINTLGRVCWMVIQTWATKEHYVSFRYAATCDLFQKSLPEKITILSDLLLQLYQSAGQG